MVFTKGYNGRVGLKHNPESIFKMSESHRKTWKSPEFRRKWTESRKLMWQRPEYLEKYRIIASKRFAGRKFTHLHRMRISRALMGRVFTEQHRRNLSLSHYGILGHDQRRKYPIQFNSLLKKIVKIRFSNTCMVCFRRKLKGLSVHHIDYDKSNNDINNLVTLCQACHVKTSFVRRRAFWINYFNEIFKTLIGGDICIVNKGGQTENYAK